MDSPPLAGIRVLDLSRMVSGPLCGRMLADLGADVVKVEPPDGDRTRTVPPFVEGTSPYFAQMNLGKRNVSVDLKAPEGPAVVARMAEAADVLIENYRAGVMARFGLAATTLLERNPRLVYCSVTGWGQDGPWRDRRSYAPLVHADTGMLDLTARRRNQRPVPEVNQHGDVYTALLAASAVLAALVQRTATGRGQHLDVAMGQAAAYVNEWLATDLQPAADGFAGFDTWNHHTYRLGDGSYITLLGDPVHLFPLWVEKLGGRPELLDDPRFTTADARSANLGALIAAVDDLTSHFADFAALEQVLDPWMLAAQVRSATELTATSWALHRGLTVEPVPGLPVPAAPWRASTSPIGAAPVVSARGENNESVLAEYGFDPDEINRLRDSGTLSA